MRKPILTNKVLRGLRILPFGVKKARNGKYGAQIKFATKNYHLGTYDTIEEAAAVAAAAKASFYSTGGDDASV